MSDKPIDVVRRLVKVWNAHDLDATYALLHEDYREYINGVLIKAKQGPDATRKEDHRVTHGVVPDWRRDVDEYYTSDSDGRCAIRWRFIGTGPNGPFEVPLVQTFLVQGGSIRESCVWGDPAALAQALDKK